MEWDEPGRTDAPLDLLERETLDEWSRDELAERIRRLEREIARTRTVLEAKSAHAREIDRLFGG